MIIDIDDMDEGDARGYPESEEYNQQDCYSAEDEVETIEDDEEGEESEGQVMDSDAGAMSLEDKKRQLLGEDRGIAWESVLRRRKDALQQFELRWEVVKKAEEELLQAKNVLMSTL